MNIVDNFGLYGTLLNYGLTISFVGSAFLLFIYFWKKGRLDMDEDSKIQMLKDDNHYEKD